MNICETTTLLTHVKRMLPVWIKTSDFLLDSWNCLELNIESRKTLFQFLLSYNNNLKPYTFLLPAKKKLTVLGCGNSLVCQFKGEKICCESTVSRRLRFRAVFACIIVWFVSDVWLALIFLTILHQTSTYQPIPILLKHPVIKLNHYPKSHMRVSY